MTSIKNIMIVLGLMITSLAYSQDFKLSIQSGIGTYQMNDLKRMNRVLYSSLPFKAKMISNYPAYLYYKPGIGFSFNRLSVGINTSLNSSGSRISSKDYSGVYLYDTRISCFAPGLYVDFQLLSLLKKYKVSITSEGGAIFSKFRYTENLTVNEQELANSDYSYKAINYFVEPGLKVEAPLISFLDLGINTGYVVQIGGESLNSRFYGSANMRTDWSGLRLGVSLIVKAPY